MSDKYDGWTTKTPKGYLFHRDVRTKRSDVIGDFEKEMGLGSWKKYRYKGWRIVKIKLVEVYK